MRIAILTQPLRSNYGGILQAFALQKVLHNMGHDVITINREFPKQNCIRLFVMYAKRVVLFYLFRRKDILVSLKKVNQLDDELINKFITPFIDKEIRRTRVVRSTHELKKISKGFNAFIVGSDQVWRPKYSPKLTNYFLDFVQSEKNIIRVAYAASFGVDNIEFSSLDIYKCKKLARKFDKVSVREASGVRMCKNYFDIEATHVLDPTMLLSKEFYSDLGCSSLVESDEKILLAYLLDYTENELAYLKKLATESNRKLKIIRLLDSKRSMSDEDFLHETIPSVDEWLSHFRNADFIVTDSFHGVAFSIIFNKNFVTKGNAHRGMTRFRSLLDNFNLNNRLVFSITDIDFKLLGSSIDYFAVNAKLNIQREQGINFLETSLKSNK